MIPKKPPKINHQIVELDLEGFSWPGNPEMLNDYGLAEIAKKACKMGAKGWSFVDCERDEDNDHLLQMLFKQPEESERAT